jgi:transposase
MDAPFKKTPVLETQLPSTVEGCHNLIRSLLNTVNELFKRVEKLEEDNRKLVIENKELRERLNNNSSNSSLPPSKDFKKKKIKKSPSKNKSGAQKGHTGHFRELLDIKEIDNIVDCHLPNSCSCGGSIKSKGDFQRHQVYELPEIKLDITEYRLKKGCCRSCGQNHVALLPKGITWGITGPKLTAFMSHLVSKYQLSRRELKEFLKEHYNFSISLGTVFNKQKIVNNALESPTAELLAAVKESSNINADETSHYRDGKKQWMWAVVSSTIAFFSVDTSRGKKVLKSLIGDYRYIVTSDRYAAYNYFDSDKRQLCWSHIKRDFTKLSEKEDKICARIGKNLLESEAKLFDVWHEFKKSKINRGELIWQCKPIRQRIGELLEQGSYTDPILKVSRFCRNLLESFTSLWTFLYIENVEPTNNHAERCVRPAVTWRKKYFGTRSDYGSEFVARTMSIRMTTQLQSKNAFQFICQTIQNYFSKTKAPSLIAYSGAI